MKRMKMGIIAVVIAAMAITVAVVGAQPPAGNGNGNGGRGQGRGIELQVIADTLGIDVQTLQTDLQNGQTIAEVATAQNVELSTIIDAVVAARTTELTQAVTDGTLTQEQADAQIALLKANLNVQLTKAMQAPNGTQTRPNGQPGQRGSDQLTTIAAALGIDVATLQSDLQSGQTIADIAKAQNVELSAITDAVVAARTTALTQAVADGTLTQEQADAQIALLKANLNASYTQSWDANRGSMGMGDMGGNGGPMGQDGNGGRHNGNGGFPGGNPPTGGNSSTQPSNSGSNA
ncbi:MAG: hypothetical protein GC179_25010 [Anaerolineaceae bacterium]|nr:hypothetical protein [Anaerolineaceae bacterium]